MWINIKKFTFLKLDKLFKMYVKDWCTQTAKFYYELLDIWFIVKLSYLKQFDAALGIGK